jgi:hypothetical protein
MSLSFDQPAVHILDCLAADTGHTRSSLLRFLICHLDVASIRAAYSPGHEVAPLAGVEGGGVPDG